MAKVSVVIPVYNIEAHLRQCLDSVAGQTLKDLEILCVDDGSTDSSPEILQEYAARDPRFTVLTQPNAGPGVARNTGMARATGEYLIFLDSDDWFEPGFLEKMVQRAEQTNADITVCKSVEFDTNTGRELPSDWMLKTELLPSFAFAPREIADHIFQFTYGWPWDKLYRTEFVRNKGLSYPPLRNSEDLVFVFESLVDARNIAIVDEYLVHHRVNRNTSTSNIRDCQPEAPYEAAKMLRDYLKGNGLWEQYEKSFLNWTVGFLVWHVSSLEGAETRKQSFRELKTRWLPELGCTDRPASYYGPGSVKGKYLLACYAPYPVFVAVTWGYRLVKR